MTKRRDGPDGLIDAEKFFADVSKSLRNIKPGEIRKRQLESIKWFTGKVKGSKDRIDLSTIAHRRRGITKFKPGQMIAFSYQPKHESTLPVYDRFPLVIVLGPAKDGFLGLNLHYIHPMLRARLLGILMKAVSNKKLSHLVTLKTSYKILKATANIPYFIVGVKHYLRGHVKSKIIRILPREWAISIFLPFHRFIKKTARQVWADSQRFGKRKLKKRPKR